MASNPPGKCCTIGVKHEGEAKGELKTINGSMSLLYIPTTRSGLAS
jgi:hypothetical protein